MKKYIVTLLVVSVLFLVSCQLSIYNGLVGYWTFQDLSLEDSSNISGAMTSHGNLQIVPGKIGNSLHLSDNKYVDVPSNLSLQTSHDVTVTFWARHTAFTFPTGYSFMVDKGGWWDGDYVCWLWAMGDNNESSYNTTYCMIEDGDYSVPTVGSPINIQVNDWHFYAFIFRENSISLQVDNETPNVLSTGGGNPVSSLPLTVGCNAYYHNGCMTGEIDELGIWNRALSSEEISYLWNNGNGLSLYP